MEAPALADYSLGIPAGECKKRKLVAAVAQAAQGSTGVAAGVNHQLNDPK